MNAANEQIIILNLVSSEIAIAWLDFDTACLLSKTKMKIGDDWQSIGSEIRQDFQNTTEGRAELEKAVTEPYSSAILAVWATKSTAQDSEVQNSITNL